MTNSLSPIASTPVVGLGTQSYTIPTTSLWTATCQTFIPYFPAGSQPQSVVASAEVQNVATVADSSGSLNNTYFIYYTAGNLYGFYIWFNINSAGTDPAPTGGLQAAGALLGIQVAGATNISAANLATAIITAMNANATFALYAKASAGASGHVVISNIPYGTATAAADSVSAAPGFTYSVTAAGSYGTPAMSGLNIVIEHGSTVVATASAPSPTQPLLGAAATFSATAADAVTVSLSSLSTADAALNAVKSIVNVYQGPAV